MKDLLEKFVKALSTNADEIPRGFYTVDQISKKMKLGRYQTVVLLEAGVKNGKVKKSKFRQKNSINRLFWTNFYKVN